MNHQTAKLKCVSCPKRCSVCIDSRIYITKNCEWLTMCRDCILTEQYEKFAELELISKQIEKTHQLFLKLQSLNSQ